MTALLLAALLAAPPLELADARGKVHRLRQYRGKVVLVNFWATWCDPCLDELPSIERLRLALAGQDFVVLGVEMGGSARTAGDTGEKLALRFPLLPDRDSSVSKAWGVKLLPTSFLVDRRGAIAFTHSGAMDWDEASARARVEALLKRTRRLP